MGGMHNLGTVFGFEVVRTLKKKSFWLMSLLFPVMALVVGGIVFFSNQATEDALKEASSQKFSIAILDESRLLNPQLIKAFSPESVASKEQGIALVRDGKRDAFFYYPTAVNKASVEVYGKDEGLFDNGKYASVAKTLLDESIAMSVSQNVRTILQSKYEVKTTTYRDGQIYDGFKQLIAPGMFLVLFYLLIVTFGNQMLNSATEEKENRVIEMILTTVRARTLITGKILSLAVLGLLQTTVVMVPIIIGYALLHDKLSLPTLDLSNLPLDPVRISVGFAIFLAGFLLFTGLLVTIGAAVPTAKEAGGFFGVVMMLVFGPLYAAPLFVSSPDSLLVQFLSYFPLTAPIPLLLRNAVGNLAVWQALIALAILVLTTALVIRIAVRVFHQGALEYSRKLSIREIFSRS